MARKARVFLRVVIIILSSITICSFYHKETYPLAYIFPIERIFSGSYLPANYLQSVSLSENQCSIAFPGLTKEIDDAVARGPFHLQKELDGSGGLVQGRIKDGKVRKMEDMFLYLLIQKFSCLSCQW